MGRAAVPTDSLLRGLPGREGGARRVGAELSGGLASAVVAVTGNVAAGIIGFAPLGPDYVGAGMLAGMATSIVVGPVAAAAGAAPGAIFGPRSTTAMLFAALLTSLAAAGGFDLAVPGQAAVVITLALGAVALSGVIQIALGGFRIGVLMKFIPYPVVSGIRNAAAILLIWSQIWPFLGVPRGSLLDIATNPAAILPGTVIVAAVTAMVAAQGHRVLSRAMVPAAALVVGTLLHFGLRAALGLDAVGPVVGPLPGAVPTPSWAGDMVSVATSSALPAVLGTLVMGAVAIAILDSVSALINLVALGSLANRRFDPNRHLVGQGLGNVAVAPFGGLSGAGIFARAAVNYQAGGRTRLSTGANGIAVLVLLLALAVPMSWIPKSALAGLIMVIAFSLIDPWSVELLGEVFHRKELRRRDLWANLSEIGAVVVVGVVVNLIAAVIAGVAVSIVAFVVQMSRSPVRRVRYGDLARSARRYDERQERLLAEHGHRTAVIELEGTVFFGSCDALAERLEELAGEGVERVLIDMRLVRRVDASGVQSLRQTYGRLRRMGVKVAFSHVGDRDAPTELGVDLMRLRGVEPEDCFETTDDALRAFERELLAKLDEELVPTGRWTPEAFGRSFGLDEREASVFAEHLEKRRYDPGDKLWSRGESGTSLFLLSTGAVELSAPRRAGRSRRTRLYSPGAVFGEMGLMGGEVRTADAIAVRPSIVLELDIDAFHALEEAHPEVALHVVSALGRIIGRRLQAAEDLIVEVAE